MRGKQQRRAGVLVDGAASPLVCRCGRDGSDEGRQREELSDGVHHIRRAVTRLYEVRD